MLILYTVKKIKFLANTKLAMGRPLSVEMLFFILFLNAFCQHLALLLSTGPVESVL